jgi:DNA-binding response OmpR family regulator
MKPNLPTMQPAKEAPKTAAEKPARRVEKDALLPDAPAVEAQASVGGNRKILVVDDNPVVLKALQMKLEASGFSVITAADGGTVVRTVQHENPALILLDVNFPPGGGGDLQWSGMTIMQWLARFLEGVQIPIIIVTGEDPAKHKQNFLAAGARAFFQKPVNYPELLAAILEALDGAPGRA